MNRQRSISDSVSGAVGGLPKKMSSLAVTEASQSTSCSSSLASLTEKESSRVALMKVLSTYRFTGKIVKWKPHEEYGFLRSDQLPEDVFFSHFHTQGLSKTKEVNNFGKTAQFEVEDIGRRSIEGRKVGVTELDPGPTFLTGVLTDWIKSGCLIQVESRPELSHNRIFAPYKECSDLKPFSVNLTVRFRIQMDKSFRLEAREVSLLAPQVQSKFTKTTVKNLPVPRDDPVTIIKDITDEESSRELIKDVGKMNSNSLASFFETQLKSSMSELVHQKAAAKVVVAVICRVGRTGGGKLEEKICRMMRADFLSMTSSKQGCSVLQTALDNFSSKSKLLLAEQLVELEEVEDFISLWTHGSQIFISMLEFLEESSLSTVGLALLGSYVELACHIGHYKPVRALLVRLVNTEIFPDILQEIDLVQLSCDKFGHHITIALLECVAEDVKEKLIKEFRGKIAELSVDPVCHSVIVACIKSGSAKQQSVIIEEVCTVSSRQADMDLAKLLTDKYGHAVVLTMLEVSRHKQIHNVLKGMRRLSLVLKITFILTASILCKQDEVTGNQFANEVYKAIKTEFHTKSAGNYPKSH